jgi:23S rRNA pseudouridine955/2504/2580 synthase
VQTFEVSEDEEGMRLDRWFRRRMPALALSHVNKIVRTGEVRVDGARVKTATRLAKGQRVRVPPVKLDAPVAPVRKISPTDLCALQDMILYEDRDLLVLDKPFGLAVQGGSGTTRHIDGMLASMPHERGDRPMLVHRLDRDTSGVLVVAKTRSIAADLGEIFRSRQARKIYWALVEGVPKPAQGRISLYLAKGEGMDQARPVRREKRGREKLEKMRIARHGDEDARHSVTYYAIVDKAAPRLAWLSLKPITGRTHQLRAHAEAIGHPIIGDRKYAMSSSDPRRNDPLRTIPGAVDRKLHLLARRLILPHPGGGTLDVTAPLPEHMRRAFDMFGFDVKRYDPIENAPE